MELQLVKTQRRTPLGTFTGFKTVEVKKSQWQEVKEAIRDLILPPERREMQNAMRYWCASGCIRARASDSVPFERLP